ATSTARPSSSVAMECSPATTKTATTGPTSAPMPRRVPTPALPGAFIHRTAVTAWFNPPTKPATSARTTTPVATMAVRPPASGAPTAEMAMSTPAKLATREPTTVATAKPAGLTVNPLRAAVTGSATVPRSVISVPTMPTLSGKVAAAIAAGTPRAVTASCKKAKTATTGSTSAGTAVANQDALQVPAAGMATSTKATNCVTRGR